jgi:ribosomal protein S18 acetylase RimI-like enzyme
MSPFETLPLERAQIGATARLLARSLDDDPAYRVLFPENATRSSGLERFFSGHLANHVPHRCTFVAQASDGAVQATVTLRPPGGIHVPGTTLARGLASLALGHGPRLVHRLLAVKNVYEALERRASEGQAYWHVHMMAVQPEFQGKGIGGALLDAALKPTVREPAPIVLTTHKAINVRFYLRAGFRVTHEESVSPAGSEPYAVWCMRRDATRSAGVES